MKPFLLISFSLSVFITSDAQFIDTYQPTAVYKQNSVKARILMFDRARRKSRIMADYFDRNGNISEHIEYDTLGENCTVREQFTYDSSNKIATQVILFYTYYDTAKKKLVFNAVPDTAIVKVEYDSLNRLKRQSYFNTARATRTEVNFSYEPSTKTFKRFYKDSIVSETTFYFDKLNIENRMVHVRYQNDGMVLTQVLTYKNKFDKAGRIRSRSVRDESPGGSEPWGPYFREIDYNYMSNGLLIKRLSSNQSDHSNWLAGLLFDYKFW